MLDRRPGRFLVFALVFVAIACLGVVLLARSALAIVERLGGMAIEILPQVATWAPFASLLDLVGGFAAAIAWGGPVGLLAFARLVIRLADLTAWLS